MKKYHAILDYKQTDVQPTFHNVGSSANFFHCYSKVSIQRCKQERHSSFKRPCCTLGKILRSISLHWTNQSPNRPWDLADFIIPNAELQDNHGPVLRTSRNSWQGNWSASIPRSVQWGSLRIQRHKTVWRVLARLAVWAWERGDYYGHNQLVGEKVEIWSWKCTINLM